MRRDAGVSAGHRETIVCVVRGALRAVLFAQRVVVRTFGTSTEGSSRSKKYHLALRAEYIVSRPCRQMYP